MATNKKPSEILIACIVVGIIGAVIGVFLANFIFVKWQKIPMDFYSYHVIFDYNAKYGALPKVANAIKVCKAIMFAFPAILVGLFLVATFGGNKRALYGEAKFASLSDITKAGLILPPKKREEKKKKTPSNPSIVIGKYKGKFLEFFGNEFAFISAPTRSGKGVGIVIPNLLHYRDSVVVLDVKNENWDITAGFRSKFQEVYLFAPSANDGKSHCYNPLDYIDRDHRKRMADIQNIANILYPVNASDGNTAYFNSQAQRLWSGLVLYMLETPNRPCTMAELIRLTTPSSGEPLNEWINKTIKDREQYPELPEDYPAGTPEKDRLCKLTAECKAELISFAGNASENTRAGIQSSMTAPMNIFTDPMVACATSKSDFKLDEVRKKKMAIYVAIQPNELDRFGQLLNLFFSQLINVNTRVLPEQDKSLKHQCLVLLDEFTALGRVEIINKSVAYIAGYNMRLMLIFQNKSQCDQFYTKEGTTTMLSNMACQIVFAPRTEEDAKSYSEMLGTQTVKGKSVSTNRGKGGGGSTSVSDQRRELMLPQELKELDQSKEIVSYNATKPILADKIRYYEEKVFEKRINLPVAEDKQPKALDVWGMLQVMRGIKDKDLTNPEQIPTYESDKVGVKKLAKENSSHVIELSKVLGFDADFIGDFNNYLNG